jgi:hypothetical protein
MILCAVAAGFSPRIGTPQSFIFMRLGAPPVYGGLLQAALLYPQAK